MGRSKNVNGQTFGRLTIIKNSDKRSKSGGIYVECTCICGKSALIRKSSILYGTTRSCGCLRIEKRQKDAGHVSLTEMLCHYKQSATIREYDFLLTDNQFFDLVQKSCHYCGEPPKLYNRYYKLNGELRAGRTSKESADRAWINVNGIDRLDNNIGYTIQNCVSCCSICNELKMIRTKIEFIQHCAKITAYQESLKCSHN